MPFPRDVRIQALIACQRHCCLCHERKHTRLQCHHIEPEADGGPDTFANCIPLCPDCHAEVMAFNPRHPFGGTPYRKEELIRRRDDWYAVISRRANDLERYLHQAPARYPSNTNLSGRAAFDYSNHNGFFRLGNGRYEFLTKWAKSSDTTIQCYNDSTNTVLAVAPVGTEFSAISDASQFDFSSRVRVARVGQIVLFENHAARYAAVRVVKVEDDSRGARQDWLEFDFWIIEDGSADFSAIA